MYLSEPELVRVVLEDYRTAPIPERLRAMLAFLEKLNGDPGSVGPEDLVPLRAQGLSDAAIAEAAYVAFMFNIMDRLADTFDFAMPSEKDRQTTVLMLSKVGYVLASLPG